MGDKVLTINGVDMEGARQDQAVSLLSGLDRFVRLVVQRKKVISLLYAWEMRKKGFHSLKFDFKKSVLTEI